MVYYLFSIYAMHDGYNCACLTFLLFVLLVLRYLSTRVVTRSYTPS